MTDDAQRPTTARRRAQVAPGDLRVLLVEDDSGDALLLLEAIRFVEVPLAVQWVNDGPSALTFLQDDVRGPDPFEVQLLLLDLKLPGMTGETLLEQLKAAGRWRHLPVIVLSGQLTNAQVRRCYDLQASSVLLKPQDLQEYIALVQALDVYWGRLARFPHLP